MSFTFSITCPTELLPDTGSWNAAIASGGFDLTLDSVDWGSQSGYLPAKLLGLHTGFELDCENQGGSAVVSSHLRSSRFELTAVSVALAVLHSLTNGEYNDDDGQELGLDTHMEEAVRQYRSTRILLWHLRSDGAAAPGDQPPLDEGESPSNRRLLLETLVAERSLVVDSANTTPRYRLHKLRRQDLLNEIANNS